jgi:hypothetical protein
MQSLDKTYMRGQQSKGLKRALTLPHGSVFYNPTPYPSPATCKIIQLTSQVPEMYAF